MDTKTKKKKIKKPILSLVNAGPLDRVSVLSTKCGGCHPKGLFVASALRQEQKSTETLVFPNSST